jgi:Glycogen recognition site of AMP-activated protein kinase
MKTTSVKSKSASRTKAITPKTQLVRIEFTHSTAFNVCIAGTFNDWHPSATDMIALGNGRWAKELTLPPGTYEYRLVVDGEWIADPHAPESAPSPFGGVNSILRVLPGDETSGWPSAIATNTKATHERLES